MYEQGIAHGILIGAIIVNAIWIYAMQMFGAFKGAMMYEAWVWRFYIRIPYWRFLKAGCRPHVGFDTSDWS